MLISLDTLPMGPHRHHTLHILAVEDHPIQAQMLHIQLYELGYAMLPVARDADEAERLFRSGDPDVLLLDIQLPGPVDGIELAHRLTAIRPVPIVFLTSMDDPETFARARLTQPCAYLTKPHNGEALARALELAVQQFAQRRGITATPDTGLVITDSLFVRVGTRLERLRLADIAWVEADGNHVHFVLLDGYKSTVRLGMSAVEAVLPLGVFMRIHRSFLVAVSAITGLDTTHGYVLVGHQQLPLGRTYREELLARFRQVG